MNRYFTTQIVGLRRHESDALLEMLYRQVETPEFIRPLQMAAGFDRLLG